MRLHLLVLVAVLAVALVGFVFVRGNQNVGATFVTAQRAAQPFTPRAVDRVLRAAPDPTSRARARAAICVARGSGELRNPWRCTLRYPGGKQIRWLVTINADGSYVGVDQTVILHGTASSSPGSITGCCIDVP